MNEGAIKFVVGVVIGAVAGAVVTYFSVQKKFDERLELEIDEFKRGYVELYPETFTETGSEADNKAQSIDNCGGGSDDKPVEGNEDVTNSNDIPQSVLDSAAQMRAVIRDSGNNSNKVRYNKIIEEGGYDMQDNKESKIENGVKLPYVIAADDYFNPMGSMADFERQRIWYDQNTGEVYDDDGQYIFDTDEVVGRENLEGFDTGIDTIFVCNEGMKMLFEIANDDPRN